MYVYMERRRERYRKREREFLKTNERDAGVFSFSFFQKSGEGGSGRGCLWH
jgi:hypothetical protein